MNYFIFQAERLLRYNGDFLVRESAKIPGQFILSGRYQDHFKHLLLVDPEGVVSLRNFMLFIDCISLFRFARKIMNLIQFNIWSPIINQAIFPLYPSIVNFFYKHRFYIFNKFSFSIFLYFNWKSTLSMSPFFAIVSSSVYIYSWFSLTEVRSSFVVNSSSKAVPIRWPYYLVSIAYFLFHSIHLSEQWHSLFSLCLRLIFLRRFDSLLTNCLTNEFFFFFDLFFVLILFASIHPIELFSNRRK